MFFDFIQLDGAAAGTGIEPGESRRALRHYHAGELAEAEALYERAPSIREEELEADHPDVHATLGALAALYRATDRAAEAEELERRVAASRH
jgi:hypothetical protein